MNNEELLAKMNARLAYRTGRKIVKEIDAAVMTGTPGETNGAKIVEGTVNNEGQPEAAAFEPARYSRRVREKSRRRHKGLLHVQTTRLNIAAYTGFKRRLNPVESIRGMSDARIVQTPIPATTSPSSSAWPPEPGHP